MNIYDFHFQPPRCGKNNGFKRARRATIITSNAADSESNSTSPTPPGFDFTMDLSADKIVVFDLDDMKTDGEMAAFNGHTLFKASSSSPKVVISAPAVCLSQAALISIIFLSIASAATGIGLILYFVLKKRRFSSVVAKY